MGLLTALAVKSAKPGTARREISDGSGLYLVIQPSGAKSWAFRYRNAEGKPRKLTIGDAELTTLEKARAAARKAATEVDEGVDPAAVKSAAKLAIKVSDSNKIEDVVAAYIERHAKEKTRPATWREAERILDRQILNRFRGKPVSSIKSSDIHSILDAIMDEGKPAAALRTLYVMRPMFRWACRRQIISVNPCDAVDPPSSPKQRDRVLSDTELDYVWRAAESIGYPFGPSVQLLIVLGQRRDEVAGLQRTEIEFRAAEWTLPAGRSKNGKPHLVPLPPLAISILANLPAIEGSKNFVFTTTGRNPVSGFSKAKRQIDRHIAATGFRMEQWTLHDLRRSFATGCASLDVAPHIVECILNHTSGVIRGIARVYNRYDYKQEKTVALGLWAAHISTSCIKARTDNAKHKRAINR